MFNTFQFPGIILMIIKIIHLLYLFKGGLFIHALHYMYVCIYKYCIYKKHIFCNIYMYVCLFIHNKYSPYTHIVCKHELNVSNCDYWFAAECSLIMNLNVINVSNSAFRDLCTKGTSSEMNGHVSVKEQECGVIRKCVVFVCLISAQLFDQMHCLRIWTKHV